MEVRLLQEHKARLENIVKGDKDVIFYNQAIKIYLSSLSSPATSKVISEVTFWIYKQFQIKLDQTITMDALIADEYISYKQSEIPLTVFKHLLDHLDNTIENNNDIEFVKWILKRLVFHKSDSDAKKTLSLRCTPFLQASVSDSDKDRHFIPYPDISDANFTNNLLKKTEFSRFKYPKSMRTNCERTTFERTINQNFLRNYLSPMTPYNGVLLFHGVGVGKSCSAISIAEQFHKVFKKKTLILMPSSLVDNFKAQIFDIKNPHRSCTGNTYYDNSQGFTSDAIAKKVNRQINSKYEMKAFVAFANYVDKLQFLEGTNNAISQNNYHELIKEEFSNRVIIIDEVHNARQGQTEKLVPPVLKLVLTHAENVKLVLLSATPMYNEAREIIDIINLLLLNDNRKPIQETQLFSEKKLIEKTGVVENILGEKIRGYISYMRSENPFTFPRRLYHKTETLFKLPLVVCHMKDIQSNAYHGKKKIGLDPEEDNVNNQTQFQISNIAYPSNSPQNIYHGEKGFNNVFDVNVGNATRPYSVTYKQKYKDILDAENLKNYSCKIDFIVDSILKSKGIVFVYSFFLHGGLLPLAIALEHRGYTKFGGKNVLNENKSKKDQRSSKKCYSILSGTVVSGGLSPDNVGEIATIKSAENKYGEKIKIILGSSVTIEGLDFKNIRELYILDPWWNLNRIEQTVGRAVRHCSHADLPEKMRNVTIYQMACADTIDMAAYEKASEKQQDIDKVEDILKRHAVDCNLNEETMYYDRKELKMPIDIENSRESLSKSHLGDTRKKFGPFKCIQYPDSPENKLDNSTNTKDFYRDDIARLTQIISSMFDNTLMHSFLNIQTFILTKEIYSSDIIAYALNEIIKKKLAVRADKSGYLIYREDQYIFQPFSSENVGLPLSQREKHVKLKINVITVSKPKKPILYKQTILSDLETAYDTHFERIKKLLKEPDNYTSAIIDYLVDRLSHEEVLNLFKPFDNITPSHKELLTKAHESLKSNYMTMVLEDPNERKLMFVQDGSSDILEVSYVDIETGVSVKAHAGSYYMNKIKAKGGFGQKQPTGKIVGFIDKKTNFKVIGKQSKSAGSVCINTSKLAVADMTSLINEINSDAMHLVRPPNKKEKGITKVDLCFVYEILLRKEATQFDRPRQNVPKKR
jgi:hypothetical protein